MVTTGLPPAASASTARSCAASGASQRFAIDRDDSLAVLARRLGDELLDPRPEPVDRRRNG
jgi:hypothetical protein